MAAALRGTSPLGPCAWMEWQAVQAHLVLRVAALDAADVGGLIQMALQAIAIGFGGGQVGGIDDVRLVGRLGMLAAGTVAGFAGFGFPAAAFLGIDQLVRILLEGVVDVFVARLAGFRADVGRRGERRSGAARRGRSLSPRRPAKQDRVQRRGYWACTASTANCAPAAWHTAQLSPRAASVFATKWAASRLRDVASAASRRSGLRRGVPALRIDAPDSGRSADSARCHWCGTSRSSACRWRCPVGLMAGKSTPEKSLWLPPWPTTM